MGLCWHSHFSFGLRVLSYFLLNYEHDCKALDSLFSLMTINSPNTCWALVIMSWLFCPEPSPSSSLPHFKPHLFTSSFLKDTDSLSTYRNLFYYVLTHSRWSINTGWNHSYAFQVHSLPDTSFFLQVLAIIPPRLCFIYRDRTTKQRLKTGTWNGTVFSLQQNLFKHCKRE